MHNIEKTIKYVGDKIKYYRILNKISLTKLSQDANISKSTLFGLEEGNSNPTISTLINIANSLNINLNELIGTNDIENGLANLNLISIPKNDNFKIYKLILTQNELFELNFYTYKMSIEVLEGSVKLIDNSISLYKGDSLSIGFNKKFKALNDGATILLKIYEVNNNYYIKEDIYENNASIELLEEYSKYNYSKLISRVIFKKTTPIELFRPTIYINYVELLKNNNESHYYFFRRYIGILGAIKRLISNFSNSYTLKYENLKTFINLNRTKQRLSKSDYSLINKTPTIDAIDLVIQSAKIKYKDIIVVNSLEELLKIDIKQDGYYLLFDELINSNLDAKIVSTTISIYRIFENILILNEKELETQELKYYNILISNLPKALYFSYNGYIDLAIFYLNILYNDLSSINPTKSSKLIEIYNNNLIYIKRVIEDSKKSITYKSLTTTESIIKDLNLKVEIKELLSPVIEDSGLYCYLLKG